MMAQAAANAARKVQVKRRRIVRMKTREKLLRDTSSKARKAQRLIGQLWDMPDFVFGHDEAQALVKACNVLGRVARDCSKGARLVMRNEFKAARAARGGK